MPLKKLHPFFESLPNVAISAHKGGAKERELPDACLAAYQASAFFSDILEIDVVQTKDGHFVLSHDLEVYGTNGHIGYIWEYTLAELKEIDIGQGHYYVTLSEFFETFPTKHATVDLKKGDSAAVTKLLKLVDDFRRADKTLVCSFSDATMTMVREERNKTGIEVATCASKSEVLRSFRTSVLGGMRVFDRTESLFVPRTIWQDWNDYLPPIIITDKFLREAKALGIPVFAWTINKEKTAQGLLEQGVNGIVTDYPQMVHGLIIA